MDMDTPSAGRGFSQDERRPDVKSNATSWAEPDAVTHSGGRGNPPLGHCTISAAGKPIGRPVSSGNVENSYGGTNAGLHVKRLERIAAEEPNPRKRDLILAACACIRTLSTKNKRLGQQVGAMTKRAVLTKRGVQLSAASRPEDIASDIVDLAGSQTVHVYVARKRFRVTTGEVALRDERFRVGTYDTGCDYRAVLDDVREALRDHAVLIGDPESKAAGCLAALQGGPATSGEVAAAVGITPRLASTHLFLLEKRQKVTKTQFGRARGKPVWLWSVAA